MGHGHGPGRGPAIVVKPKNFWKTSGRLAKYMSTYVVGIVVVLALAIASAVFQIKTPKILGQATTEIYKGLMTGIAQQKAGIKINGYQSISIKLNTLSLSLL
jgi:hypothetical protein